MRIAKALGVVVASTMALLLGLWCASQWWQKAFATRTSTEVSPNGCYRLEEYKPYWILPDSFHPRFEPYQRWNLFTDWYAPWFPNEHPGFYRLYDNHTGEILGESDVYDLSFNAGAGTSWPSEWLRSMMAGHVLLAENLPACRFVPAGAAP